MEASAKSNPAIQIVDLELTDLQLESFGATRNKILIIPINWKKAEEPPHYASSTISALKVLRENSVPVASLDSIRSTTTFLDRRGLDWFAPTMFISGLLFSQDPMAINVALNVLANYVTDLFRGRSENPHIRLDIVYTSSKGKYSKEISYDGPASSLQDIAQILTSIEDTDK